MKDITILPLKSFNKTLYTASDKSITHRAVMFNSVADGCAQITNALMGEDCISTINCMRHIGASIKVDGNIVSIEGAKNINSSELYVGNSGTTIRLLSGLLSGIADKSFVLSGDSSIAKRPMVRVTQPLEQMGAKIFSNNGYAPLSITGAQLSGITYNMLVASAQVKSAILLAGLNADGETVVTEDFKSRDHTERMLKALGANIVYDPNKNIAIVKKSRLTARGFRVPGDISSAAYVLALAAVIKGGNVTVKGVGINQTRTGILDVLNSMGANITLSNKTDEFEPIADVTLKYSELKPFNITKQIMPRLIDEVPILAVLACFCKGTSVISGAQELKVKESNRIDTVCDMLCKMGANVTKTDDGMIIEGTGELTGGCEIDSLGDHRIAMSAAVAAAASIKGARVVNPDCAAVSYPGFFGEVIG